MCCSCLSLFLSLLRQVFSTSQTFRVTMSTLSIANQVASHKRKTKRKLGLRKNIGLRPHKNSTTKVKVLYRIAVNGSTPWHSYGVSLAIWDHTVLPATRHKWTHAALTPAMQAGTRFTCTYPGGMEGWVDLVDLIAPRPGVELATFRSRVQRSTNATTKILTIQNENLREENLAWTSLKLGHFKFMLQQNRRCYRIVACSDNTPVTHARICWYAVWL